MKAGSQLEALLCLHLRAANIPYQQEFRFAAEHVGLGDGIRSRLKRAGLKDWRFDFLIDSSKLAVEVEGIVWGEGKKGRHQTGSGFEGDLHKYAAAMELGFTVYRCSGRMVKSGDALRTIERLILLHR